MNDPVDPRMIRSRKAVLSAARTLLPREGPGAISHQRVAQQAGVEQYADAVLDGAAYDADDPVNTHVGAEFCTLPVGRAASCDDAHAARLNEARRALVLPVGKSLATPTRPGRPTGNGSGTKMTRGRRPAPQQKPHFVWEGDAAATARATQSGRSAEATTVATVAEGADGEAAPGGRGGRRVPGRILIGAAVLALLGGGLYALLSGTGGSGGHEDAVAAARVSSVPSVAPSTGPAASGTPTPGPSPSVTPSPTEKAPSTAPTEAPQHVQTVYVTPTQPAAATSTRAAVAPSTHSAPAVSGEVVGLDSMCLDDRGGGVSNGNPVQIFSCDSTNSQVWTVEPDGTVRSAGMCMDVTGGNDVDGTLIDLYQCNNTGAQVWQPRSNGELYNPLSGKCLDDPKFGGSGTQLDIWDCNDGTNQQWNMP